MFVFLLSLFCRGSTFNSTFMKIILDFLKISLGFHEKKELRQNFDLSIRARLRAPIEEES